MATNTLAKTDTHLDGIVRRDGGDGEHCAIGMCAGWQAWRTAPCAEARWSADHDRARSSAIGPIGILVDIMTPIASWHGPSLNRDTGGNVQKADFSTAAIGKRLTE